MNASVTPLLCVGVNRVTGNIPVVLLCIYWPVSCTTLWEQQERLLLMFWTEQTDSIKTLHCHCISLVNTRWELGCLGRPTCGLESRFHWSGFFKLLQCFTFCSAPVRLAQRIRSHPRVRGKHGWLPSGGGFRLEAADGKSFHSAPASRTAGWKLHDNSKYNMCTSSQV